jgi:hypothetical protein
MENDTPGIIFWNISYESDFSKAGTWFLGERSGETIAGHTAVPYIDAKQNRARAGPDMLWRILLSGWMCIYSSAVRGRGIFHHRLHVLSPFPAQPVGDTSLQNGHRR